MITLPEEKEILEEVSYLEVADADVHTSPVEYIENLRSNLKHLKNIKDRVQSRKEEITKPLREALESARDLFRPIERKIFDVELGLKADIMATEERRLRDQATLLKQVKSGAVSSNTGLSLMSAAPKGLFRKIKVLQIKNKKLIPDKYWVIDEVAVRAALVAGKKVPGATLIEQTGVVSK